MFSGNLNHNLQTDLLNTITSLDAIHSNRQLPHQIIPLLNGGSLTIFKRHSLLQPLADDYYEIRYTDHSENLIASRWTLTATSSELDSAIDLIMQEYHLNTVLSNMSSQ